MATHGRLPRPSPLLASLADIHIPSVLLPLYAPPVAYATWYRHTPPVAYATGVPAYATRVISHLAWYRHKVSHPRGISHLLPA